MTPIIVDASVAVKWFVLEEHRAEAACLLGGELRLVAPDFLLTEFANIIWKKSIRGEVAAEQAKLLIEVVPFSFSRIVPATQVVAAALDIGLEINHSVYDCVYLACADELCGFLLTADYRLYTKTRNTRFSTLVRYVGDAPMVAAFSCLAVSLRTVLDVIKLAAWSKATSDSVYAKIRGEQSKFKIVPVEELGIPSPNHIRLEEYLNNLSDGERSDLIALARFGDALPGQYHDWAQCRSVGGNYDVSEYFIGYMQPQLLGGGLERFFGKIS